MTSIEKNAKNSSSQKKIWRIPEQKISTQQHEQFNHGESTYHESMKDIY